MRNRIWNWVALAFVMIGVQGAERVAYENSFESSPEGQLPDPEFLVLDGQFVVRKEGTNSFVELPGAPLETFGFLFGPAAKDGLAVQARMLGTKQGRRAPAFSVGLNGVAGYRLQVSPAKRALELYRSERFKTSIPFDAWVSGEWLWLKLQVQKTGEKEWKIRGKVWPDQSKEPQEWMIESTETEDLPPGRATVYGRPYAGTAIWFDDLKVVQVEVKR